MLGMTKRRAKLPWRAVAGLRAFFVTVGTCGSRVTACDAEESATLPFVIPSAPGFPDRGTGESSVCGFL